MIRRFSLILLAFLVLEIVLIGHVDRPLALWLHDLDQQNKSLIDIFRAYTDLGKSKWYLWPAAAAILLSGLVLRLTSLSQAVCDHFRRGGEFFLFLFICVAASGLFTDILKPLLGRARPVELIQEGIYGFHPLSFAARWNSLPSGHATTAFALTFAVAHCFPRVRLPAFLLGFILAFSRIMVNAHYLSDVIAGGLMGFLTVELILWLKTRDGIRHIIQRFFPIDGDKAPR